VPDAQHNDFGPMDLVHEHIRSDRQFDGAGHRSKAPESRIDAQSVGCRDDRASYPASGGGIVSAADIGSDILDVDDGRVREPYLHLGRGNSFSVPHDISQRRTAS
jgi:hypothetical protein